MPTAMSEVATPLPPPQIHPCRSLLHSPWNCAVKTVLVGALGPLQMCGRVGTLAVGRPVAGWLGLWWAGARGELVGLGSWGRGGAREGAFCC